MKKITTKNKLIYSALGIFLLILLVLIYDLVFNTKITITGELTTDISLDKNVNDSFPPIITIDESEIKQKFSNSNYTFIHIWTSWCSPCAAELDKINDLYKKLRHNSLSFYLISGDINTQEQVNILKKYLRKKGILFPSYIISSTFNIMDLKNLNRINEFITSFNNKFQKKGLPVTMIFNKDGILIFNKIGILDEADIDNVISLINN